MESLKDFGEPRLVAILEEKGNDEQNLIAVMELYAPIAYPGKNQRRNHVLITIYEKASLPDYIEKTGDKDRILYIKEGFQQTRQADLQLVGAVSKETLSRNVAQFNKKVKAFKDKNKIDYSLSREGAQYVPGRGFSIPGEAVKLRREAETTDAAQGDLDPVAPESTPVAEDTAQSAPDRPTQPQQPKAQPSQDMQPQEQPDEHPTEEKKEPREIRNTPRGWLFGIVSSIY